jgi:hypothetical protein
MLKSEADDDRLMQSPRAEKNPYASSYIERLLFSNRCARSTILKLEIYTDLYCVILNGQELQNLYLHICIVYY